MASLSNITYKVLDLGDLSAVRALIEENYTPHTALGKHLNCTKETSMLTYYTLIEPFLSRGNSIGAFHGKDDELRGVAINVKPDEKDWIKYENTLHLSEKEATVNRLLTSMLGNDLSTVLGTGSYWEIKMLTVLPKYRGKGLMTELVKRSAILARQRGIEKLVMYETYDQRLKSAEKMDGFEIIKQLDLKEYVDSVTGEKEFSGMKSPYDVQAIIAKKL
uniref:uncharacterized protein LOC120329808 n=1 Tax=Styela clava TaxID=7725 RepID=UPI00193A7362|nr:uncharacterized protein LOC120329808 [Styela clava]